jgi:quercetin dioxygenase-like cupin family protein
LPVEGPQHAKRIDKPWGYQLLFAATLSYAGGVDVIHAGRSLSLQYHQCRDETLFLHRGRLLVELEDATGKMHRFELVPDQSIHLVPPRKHRVTALEDSIIFEVSTPQLDDVVRLEDLYGRAGEQAGNPAGAQDADSPHVSNREK